MDARTGLGLPTPSRELPMRVRRWGNRLAIVLPEEVAEDLALVEGSIAHVRLARRD